MSNLLPNYLHIKRKFKGSPSAIFIFFRESAIASRKAFRDRNNKQKCDRQKSINLSKN